MVDEAVLHRLLRGEPAVAVGVDGDLLHGLTGVQRLQPVSSTLLSANSAAWMAMSAAVPPIPADGWCIMIRACGSA